MVTPDRGVTGSADGALTRSALAMLGMLAGCVAHQSTQSEVQPASEVRSAWQPVQTISGARVAIPDPTGMPLPQGPAPYTRLVMPVAAVAGGPDYYIADAGASRIYRYDPVLDLMSVVGGAAARLDTRLVVGPDLSLFVVDAAARRVVRYTRDGRIAVVYANAHNLGRPVAAAWDEARGQLVVADALFRHLVAFHPTGEASYILPLVSDEKNQIRSIGAIAVGRSSIHVTDPVCRCVLVVTRDGRIAYSYGHNVLVQPGSIALDREERAYVADTGASVLRVYAGVREIARVPAATLGLAQVSDIAVYHDTIVATDLTTARVVAARIPASLPAGPYK